MPRSPTPRAMMRDAADSLRHALDPVVWAAERLNWHADPWQAEYMRCTDPQVAVLCSRQSGKSTSTAVTASHCAVFEPGALTLLISPTQRQATELLTKCRAVLTHPGVAAKLDQNAATSLELRNGSRIVSLPSSPDAIRGYSAPRLLIEDEAAYVDDAVHLALRPMMAASPHCRFLLLSTPHGRAGHFFEACHSPEWMRFKVTAYECPRITKEFLERELREYGDLRFSSEYLCDFSDSEFSFFGSDLIASAMECDAEPLKVRLFT